MEGPRRRSTRLDTDQHTLERAENLVKNRNLENNTGIICKPSSLHSATALFHSIASKVGVSLGKDKEEVDSTVMAIQRLEEARCELYMANKRKDKGLFDLQERGLGDEISDPAITLGDSDREFDKSDVEINDLVKVLAGIGCSSASRNRGRGRGRGRANFNSRRGRGVGVVL